MIILDTKEKIKNYTRIREPMLLIDYAEVEFNKEAICTKKIEGNEWFLKGHYPDNPILPGCSLLEIMSQAAGMMYGKVVFEGNEQPRLVGVEKVRFYKEVKKNDDLCIKAKFVENKHGVLIADVRAYVQENCVCTANIKQYFKKYGEENE